MPNSVYKCIRQRFELGDIFRVTRVLQARRHPGLLPRDTIKIFVRADRRVPVGDDWRGEQFEIESIVRIIKPESVDEWNDTSRVHRNEWSGQRQTPRRFSRSTSWKRCAETRKSPVRRNTYATRIRRISPRELNGRRQGSDERIEREFRPVWPIAVNSAGRIIETRVPGKRSPSHAR